MSLAKVIEVMGEGSTIEEAVQNIAEEASKTVHNIKSIYMENIQAIVEDDQVDHYRIDAKVTFLLEE
ncbi:dodecin family protein [Fodinibius saliphilus]|uniref:dodecin family protein n=1 Tax=Fodinibius saliphilus TaxID=1920650 RepID=UPI00110983AE|nr:dodecin family protein [Fodinibius saliphilus]